MCAATDCSRQPADRGGGRTSGATATVVVGLSSGPAACSAATLFLGCGLPGSVPKTNERVVVRQRPLRWPVGPARSQHGRFLCASAGAFTALASGFWRRRPRATACNCMCRDGQGGHKHATTTMRQLAASCSLPISSTGIHTCNQRMQSCGRRQLGVAAGLPPRASLLLPVPPPASLCWAVAHYIIRCNAFGDVGRSGSVGW